MSEGVATGHEAGVTVVFEGRITTFRCDCGAEYIDHLGGWNGGRAAMTRAKERGWSLRRVRVGQWRATCPECSLNS